MKELSANCAGASYNAAQQFRESWIIRSTDVDTTCFVIFAFKFFAKKWLLIV